MNIEMKLSDRSSGVLLHISSLPSNYGIGTLGKEAKDFVDFLVDGGQKYWQILPICPTSYGDSPYQSFSTYAGNPYFIDLDALRSIGLLQMDEYAHIDFGLDASRVDYEKLYRHRYDVLRIAARRFCEKYIEPYENDSATEATAKVDIDCRLKGDATDAILRAEAECSEIISRKYREFCHANAYWLDDYALFMSQKDAHDGRPWYEWEEGLKYRDENILASLREKYIDDIDFWKIVQYLFFNQWKSLRDYANDRGIRIIGDLPIYVSYDSVDVWVHPELFLLDENRVPTEVAGCPPDNFSADGQLWGNPLFDWEYMARDGYAWWIDRIRYLCDIYDVLRIDHFRGFDSYYAIPYGDTDARRGSWKMGPGMKLFCAVENSIGRKNIIAEDLGFLTDSVKQLLHESGYPGMKVLEFAFDSRDGGGSMYMPENYPEGCVAYVGTHDNDTAVGWSHTAMKEDVQLAYSYLGEDEPINISMMRAIWKSSASIAIVQAQDLLGLGSEARMNIPSTVGENWRWRAGSGDFSEELARWMASEMLLFKRKPLTRRGAMRR